MPRFEVPQRHVLALIAAAACWGLGAVASKRAVAELAPTPLLTVQLATSITVLSVVRRVATRPLRTRPGFRMLALGVLNPGVAYLLSLAGLASITAGLSVLLWALEPVFIVVLAWLMMRDRIAGRTALLMGAAVAGAAMAGAGGLGGIDAGGVALTVAAVACCAVYTVAASSWFETESNLDIVIGQQWFALAFAVIVLALSSGRETMAQFDAVGAGGWISAAGSGVVYYGLAFWAYLSGLRHASPAVAAMFLNLIPLFGIAGGWLFLGERMTGVQIVGAAVVVAAVTGLSVGPSRRLAPR